MIVFLQNFDILVSFTGDTSSVYIYIYIYMYIYIYIYIYALELKVSDSDGAFPNRSRLLGYLLVGGIRVQPVGRIGRIERSSDNEHQPIRSMHQQAVIQRMSFAVMSWKERKGKRIGIEKNGKFLKCYRFTYSILFRSL